MEFGGNIAQIRKDNGLSREEFGKKVGTSAAIIKRCERNGMKPSVEIATKIAQALNVSLDYLVGNSALIAKGKNIMERIEGIANMPSLQKTELFNVIDAYLRGFRTRQAYIGH